MIQAHLISSWTKSPDRESWEYGWSMILGGFGAPLFLFLAGVAVSLSAGDRLRRTGDLTAASNGVVRRGLEIFGLAFLFRVQAWILGWSAARKLLKVDILNIMGPSIMAAAALWGLARTVRARYVVFACATLALPLLTPIVHATRFLDPLPDPIEAYIRPAGGLTSFAFFPWSGFLFAGALVGLSLDQVASRQSEARLNGSFVAAGTALALVAYAVSFLPTPYAHSEFWASSPAYFFLRTGILLAAVGVSYFWESRSVERFSPLRELGRHSLFIYWIHVEMVYGLISRPLHQRLGLGAAWAAFAAFSLFMLLCALAKGRVVAELRAIGAARRASGKPARSATSPTARRS